MAVTLLILVRFSFRKSQNVQNFKGPLGPWVSLFRGPSCALGAPGPGPRAPESPAYSLTTVLEEFEIL